LPATSGSGTTNILFNYDANVGPTRTGTIAINGKTVQIMQAGVGYVQAPGPLTTLVSTGLAQPWGVAVDPVGNVIISDTSHSAIKQWSPILNTVSSLTTTGLASPEGIALDAVGNIYVADNSIRAIKKRRASDGALLTAADDWPYTPSGVAVDAATNVYWSGQADDAVKQLLAANGSISTVVGTNLNGAYGIAVDVASAIYIADTFNHAIKKWNPVSSSLTTLGTNGIGNPWDVTVDGSGNVYVANGLSNNIVRWNAASGKINTVVPGGLLSLPTGVSVDSAQNIFISDFGANTVFELPYAFVDASTRFEPATAGGDSLPVILPAGQSLQPPFAPTVSDPWLAITNITGGVISFSFTANPSTSARAAFITVLGQNVFVNQAGVILPTDISVFNLLTNGVFHLGLTNGTRGGIYSVLFTTNVLIPMTNWAVIGTATNNGFGLWEFTDTSASNDARFYRIRSP